jgi:hypothetical protein
MAAEYLVITRRFQPQPALQLQETYSVTNNSVFVWLCGSLG